MNVKNLGRLTAAALTLFVSLIVVLHTRAQPGLVQPSSQPSGKGVRAVILIPPSRLVPEITADGKFAISFTNHPTLTFDVLTSTNLLTPSKDWSFIGQAIEGPAGTYRFTDPNPRIDPHRFYRVCLH